MKRIIIIALSFLITINLIACSQNKKKIEFQKHYDLGIQYQSEEKYEDALLAFNEALEIDPKSPDVYIGLAESYLCLGEYDKALDTIEQASLSCNDYENYEDKTIDFDDIKKEVKWNVSYENGIKCKSNEDYESAIIAFEKSIEIDEKKQNSYLALADTYLQLEDYDSALETISKGREACGNMTNFDVLEDTIIEVMPKPSEGLEYVSNNDGTCYVAGLGTCEDAEIVIPKISPDGDVVISIGDRAFDGIWMDNQKIASISIPSSVISIGERAFHGLLLESITLPNGITSIGSNAFSMCYDLKNAFIPGSLVSWGDSVFSNCTSLENVTIQDGVTEIGNYAFNRCTSLEKIILPESVTSIGDHAFLLCAGLKSITFSDNITSIGEYAFAKCGKLDDIILPDRVKTIGHSAFLGCKQITNITIPNSVESIGELAFADCKEITNISIPNCVTSIGDYAFYSCEKLNRITISNSVTFIGDSVFENCSSLTDIYFDGTLEQWSDAVSYFSLYKCSAKVICSDGVTNN